MEDVDEVELLLKQDDELTQYLPLFKHHEIREDVFAELSPKDLNDIGIKSLGHRIKIMRLVNQFKKKQVDQVEPVNLRNMVLDMSERLDFYDSILKRANDQLNWLRQDIVKRKSLESPRLVRRDSEQNDYFQLPEEYETMREPPKANVLARVFRNLTPANEERK